MASNKLPGYYKRVRACATTDREVADFGIPDEDDIPNVVAFGELLIRQGDAHLSLIRYVRKWGGKLDFQIRETYGKNEEPD